jgi:hypothetical protein
MELKPEAVLVKEWIPTYKVRIEKLHIQLAEIRSTLFVLEHVAMFPFDLFGEHPGPFWRLVRHSLETSVVVGLWRIFLDTDDQTLTLRRLKNQVMSKTIDSSARDLLAEELRSRNVDTRIAQIEAKVCNLRNNYFAHLKEGSVTTPPVPALDPRITLEELLELATAAHNLINAIGIGTDYMTMYPGYDPTIARSTGERIKPDVECLFDDMVARCEDLRMPELKPHDFQFYWRQRTPKQRSAFNEYRKKFGLPDMPTDS